MKSADVVVIGGSAAGAVAAVSCRRRYEGKSVLVIRKEGQVQVPCGIPYIFGTLGSVEKNVIPDALLQNNGVEIVKEEVLEVNREKKTVLLSGGESVGYDKLVMATGSLPITVPIPGADKENVFAINKDANYLKSMLGEINVAQDIVIIGGGFIGVEFADECRKNHACNVTIVEILPHCLQMAMDEEFCIEAESLLPELGVKVCCNQRVETILGDRKVTGVRLSDGRELKADVVIMGVGAIPNIALAAKAGLQTGKTKAIMVDRYMRTVTDQDIFACGDCAEKVSFFSGSPSAVMLASVATAEARTVGANLFVTRQQNGGEIGVFSTMVGGRAFACAGLTEKAARQEGYDVVVGEAVATDTHPGGMPGAVSTKVKLVFSRGTGILLGGGISGGKSAGEMINVVSACIQHKMTFDEVALFQMGTHPALTASPIAYQIVNAAELAAKAA